MTDEDHNFKTILRYNKPLYNSQLVPCKVIGFNLNHQDIPLVEIIEKDLDILNIKKKEDCLLKALVPGLSKEKDTLISILLSKEDDILVEEECHQWLRNLVHEHKDLVTLKNHIQESIEQSDLLDSCTEEERWNYEQRFTMLLDFISYYITIENWYQEEDHGWHHINVIFQKLKKSGYVYHSKESMGVGLDSDLAYIKFNFDQDKYVRYLIDSIKRYFDKTLLDFIEVSFDEENKDKEICKVSISPYSDGVKLNGDYYVRIGSESLRFSSREFKNHRKIMQQKVLC